MSAGQPWARGFHRLVWYTAQHLVVGLRQVWPLAADGDRGAVRNSVINVALHLWEAWGCRISFWGLFPC